MKSILSTVLTIKEQSNKITYFLPHYRNLEKDDHVYWFYFQLVNKSYLMKSISFINNKTKLLINTSTIIRGF